MTPPLDLKRRIVAAVAAIGLLLPTLSPAGTQIEQQRELFRQVFGSVELGNWAAVDALPDEHRDLLQHYVLWPDLRATWFRARIRTADHAEIDAFLERYGTLKPARELRYRYALQLAEDGDLGAFLEIYEAFYQGLEIAKLDCLALQAEIAAGRADRITQRARALWMTGASQADECDPVFAHLRAAGRLEDSDYRARYALAVEAREFARARWLARSLDEALVNEATLWLQAQSSPEGFIAAHRQQADSDVLRRQLAYAIERITFVDPARALELWESLARDHAFPADLRHATLRHIALWMARDNLPDAYDQLTALPLDAQDEEVMRWRARSSLRAEHWDDLLNDIVMMTAAERDSELWQYWHGIALARTGREPAARSVFDGLARERSYYGFLAADEIGASYALANEEFDADESLIDAIARRDDVIRARELFLVGLDSRGRSEWDTIVADLTPQEKVQAAILAHRWGWHSRAIATAAAVGHYDDLVLRYPLPFRASFEQYSSTASIPATWALGVARSESLFMRDVRSRAGAVGLMQLMPATGRRVARELQLPYAGLDTLTDPEQNIRLGTSYLASMADRYAGNRVLATAAYNAGPQRVDRWLPDTGAVDARIWIENIPFDETRNYVRRVMAAETIFHWRMTGQVRRLSRELAQVRPAADDRQVASR